MRQSLNQKECATLLADNYIGYLGYISKNSPFIVPITYFFDGKKTIIIYSSEGHKINAMRKNNNVSLQVSEIKNIDNWNSVLAHGNFEELSGIDAKHNLHEFADGIKNIILRKEEINLHFIGEFSSKINKEEIPIVGKITINELTGKTRIN
ncbi:flavin mononucleotide-binding protein [Polaribacter vadi]|uniref:Flavin mononucleotide-binding protein n=1 Tax=Polaribacter vadi TaxID=1774273 RepID=A0A1B8TX63_9FLAO|nr:pyridoxamine 5'-phosphate oxidase family protein [Polaribacter vadi]AOW16849.1 flavin mononucleotide-binding protein [Polaribacter vadi]OBY64243.1 flavin mononucleotide-binding protein [Polaribacter vadi]